MRLISFIGRENVCAAIKDAVTLNSVRLKVGRDLKISGGTPAVRRPVALSACFEVRTI